ncbi:putative plectin-like [Sesbania bispinosa]|nr:putative plectin-like [Sesbania bispinosa]
MDTLLMGSEAQHSHNAVESDQDEPSNNALKNEVEPSIYMLDVKTNTVNSEVLKLKLQLIVRYLLNVKVASWR